MLLLMPNIFITQTNTDTDINFWIGLEESFQKSTFRFWNRAFQLKICYKTIDFLISGFSFYTTVMPGESKSAFLFLEA